MPLPPAGPRPERPSTCVNSWNVRSADEKSGRLSCVSAFTTPTSETPGRSKPFATICVPTMTCAWPLRIRSYMAAWAPFAFTASPSIPVMRAFGTAAPPPSSTRSVPTPHRRRARHLAAATMADQPSIGVERERDLARGTRDDVAAVPAQHDRREAAPVEVEDRLLAFRDDALERRPQGQRERRAVVGLQLEAEVDDRGLRQREVEHPLGQREERDRAGLGRGVRDDARRRAPEYDDPPRHAPQLARPP